MKRRSWRWRNAKSASPSAIARRSDGKMPCAPPGDGRVNRGIPPICCQLQGWHYSFFLPEQYGSGSRMMVLAALEPGKPRYNSSAT